MTAIFKHELRCAFQSLTAYLFCAFLLLFIGVGAMLYNLQSAVANFEYVLQFVAIGMIVFIPILTMKVIADEKKQKTEQLLYSLPLSSTQVVLGKFLALLVIFLIPMAITGVYPLIFKQYGEVYLPASYGSIAAFYFMGAAMIAIGMFISSLTENMGFAAGIAIPLFLFNYYSVKLAEYVSSTAAGSMISIAILLLILVCIIWHVTKSDALGYIVGGIGLAIIALLYWKKQEVFVSLLPNIMKQLSLFERLNTFVNGVFDVTALIFYVTVIIFFLFLTVQSLEKRRYN